MRLRSAPPDIELIADLPIRQPLREEGEHFDLPGREARDLTRGLCLHAGRRGWAGLQMPHLPYFGATPLWRARFVPYPKQLIVAAVSFDAPLPPRPRGVYLDWR